MAIIVLLMPVAIWVYKVITDNEQRELDSKFDINTGSNFDYIVDPDYDTGDIDSKELSSWPNFSFQFLINNMMSFERHTAYILRSRDIANDDEAHDDELHALIESDFKESCNKIVSEIDLLLGDHENVSNANMQAYFGPVLEYQWRNGNRLFYLAVCHEEREDPYFIQFGVKRMKKVFKS